MTNKAEVDEAKCFANPRNQATVDRRRAPHASQAWLQRSWHSGASGGDPCSERDHSTTTSRTRRTLPCRLSISYMTQVHAGLDVSLSDPERPPLMRVRDFFEMTQKSYREEGYMGCLLGGLGQELSGVSEVFRDRIAGCFAAIAERVAGCLEEARQLRDIPQDSNVKEMADLLVDCWEGAALRSRLQRSPIRWMRCWTSIFEP
jgi:hypothetical protein